MESILEKLKSLRTYVGKLKLNNINADVRIVSLNEAFPKVHNEATMCLEMLSYYYDQWNHSSAITEMHAETNNERSERVIKSLKSMYIFSMSAIEFSFFSALKKNPSPYKSINKNTRFSDIVNKSDARLINESEKKKWDIAIRVRNKLVHTNGIWNETSQKISYVDGIEFIFVENEMIRGDLNFLIILSEWMIKSYHDWCVKLLNFELT